MNKNNNKKKEEVPKKRRSNRKTIVAETLKTKLQMLSTAPFFSKRIF